MFQKVALSVSRYNSDGFALRMAFMLLLFLPCVFSLQRTNILAIQRQCLFPVMVHHFPIICLIWLSNVFELEVFSSIGALLA